VRDLGLRRRGELGRRRAVIVAWSWAAQRAKREVIMAAYLVPILLLPILLSTTGGAPSATTSGTPSVTLFLARCVAMSRMRREADDFGCAGRM